VGVSHARSDGLAHLKPDYTPDGAALESTEMWGRGEPRQGRKIVAQGASPGEGALTPPTASLSPRGGERGRGEGVLPYPRLAPRATIFRPLCGLARAPKTRRLRQPAQTVILSGSGGSAWGFSNKTNADPSSRKHRDSG